MSALAVLIQILGSIAQLLLKHNIQVELLRNGKKITIAELRTVAADIEDKARRIREKAGQ